MDEIMILEGIEESKGEAYTSDFEDEEDCPICDEMDEDEEFESLPGRHCVAVKERSDGLCGCAEYAPGPKPPHKKSFGELCRRKGLETFGGNNKGGSKMAQRKSPRRKRSYQGLGGPLGKFGLDEQLVKQLLITGGVMAGAGYFLKIIRDNLSGALKLQPNSQWNNLLLGVLGIIGAGITYSFTKKKDIALAVGAGPMMIVMLNVIGKAAEVVTSVPATAETAGLGLITGERSAQAFQPAAQPPIEQFSSASNLFASSTVV